MKHYGISEWADYARELPEPAKREAMHRHLSDGCATCGKVAAVFGRVAPVAAAEARYEPPEYAVHCARAISVLDEPREVRIMERLLGRLVFDSFREPLPAGVRSRQHVSRQTMYEAPGYTVDLRQDHERGGERITMVGQLASRTEAGRPVSGIPVKLSAHRSVLATAVSNRFGEFQMEYVPARGLRLDIGGTSPAADAHPERAGARGGSE